nr:uncharacterized protein LOC123769117 [Procambarus clarkii]
MRVRSPDLFESYSSDQSTSSLRRGGQHREHADSDSSSSSNPAASSPESVDSPPPPPPSPSPPPPRDIEIVNIIRNFNGAYTRYSFSVPEHVRGDPGAYLRTYRAFFINFVSGLFTLEHPHIRVFPDFTFGVRRLNVEPDDDFDPVMHMRGEMRAITQEEVEQLVNLWVEEIDNKLEELLGEQEGSSVGIESILGFYINVALIEHPIRLGSFVDYPAKLRGKGHVFNPRGEANICLMQCIAVHKCLARGLLYNDIKTRAKSGRWCRRQVRWSNNIGTPVSFDDIAKVEDLNRSSIFIYVLVKGDNGRHYISLARKGRGNFKDVISLLMLEGQHLVLIKNFSFNFQILQVQDPVKQMLVGELGLLQKLERMVLEDVEVALQDSVKYEFPVESSLLNGSTRMVIQGEGEIVPLMQDPA